MIYGLELAVVLFLFVCAGVIWRGDSVIDGVPETLDMLRAAVSDNSIRGGAQLGHSSLTE
jgi:ribonucleotide monophosphatase NagD (HAD superfamily)